MSASVREYQVGDLDRCRQLWRSLVQRHRDIYEDPTIGGPDPGVEFDAHLKHPQLHCLWVVADADQLLGLCGLLVQEEASELEPIIVDPNCRGRGVDALLARRAIEESRRLGLKCINVRPVARNLEAIRFFHREGHSEQWWLLRGHQCISGEREAAQPILDRGLARAPCARSAHAAERRIRWAAYEPHRHDLEPSHQTAL